MVHSLRTRPIVIEELTFPEVDYQSLRKDYQPPEQIVLPYNPPDAPPGGKDQSQHAPKPARFAKLQKWTDRADRIERIAQWSIFIAGAVTMAPTVLRLFH
ncbi:MAG TPA: hypothetical protein V6D22_18260 [Candidatus Obscuribacterales bacterium]